WNNAEAVFSDALQLARTMPDNPRDTLISLNDLSVFYVNTRRFAKAVRSLSESIALQAKELGENDPALAANINMLGISYRELRRYDEAAAVHQKALRILTAAPPEHSLDIALTLSALGSVADMQRDLTKAQQYHKRALDSVAHVSDGSADLARVR